MDPRRHQQTNAMFYSNLFNLEPLMNFRLPQHSEEFDSYGNTSQEESTSGQGQGAMPGYGNGGMSDRSNDLARMQRKYGVELEMALDSYSRRDADSNDEDDGDYESRISEEKYRAMLGEHVQKYRRVRTADSSLEFASLRMALPSSKRNHGTKPLSKEEAAYRDIGTSPEYTITDFELDYNVGSRFDLTLDIGEGYKYDIPPTYDRLAAMLNLPSFSDLKVYEYFLKGTLDLRSLATFVASDGRFEGRSRGGLGDPQPQYESLQARLKSHASSNSNQNFTLHVSAVGSDSIPEGSAGRIRRCIMSDSGNLQVYYVRVLEKSDSYEIKEMDKIGKVWVNIVRRDIPRHHRTLTIFHQKQIADAKRLSETCQREVNLKVGRSIKLMRGAAIRTRKLARDMLLFWKRVDNEQAELRKKEEKEAVEALKREEELRELKNNECQREVSS